MSPARRQVTPRAALSARELDRVQKELEPIRDHLAGHANEIGCSHCKKLVRDLTRVLGMLQRAERR